MQEQAARRWIARLSEGRFLAFPEGGVPCPPDRRCLMFKWALIFAVIALLAALLGFGGVAGAAAGVAKILFFVGLALVALFLVLGVVAGRKVV
jgi:uncharacterized membrane protein YtjA (UPF0391 family)